MLIGYRWVAQINRIFLVLVLLLQVGCAQVIPASQWESPLYRNHPLVGKLWHAESGRFVTEAELWQEVEAASYLILGEKHDNPDHHELQLDILSQLLQRDVLSKLTLEMLDSSSSDLLQSLSRQEFSTSAELRDYLRWDSEGWDWGFYGPLIETAYSNGLPIKAGNISGETVGAVYGQPTSPEIAAVFDDEVMARLTRDIDESHCGLLPESQFASMVRVQQTRDYTMAKEFQNPDSTKLALLIAGNYHARQDLGVPNYLLAQDDQLQRSQIISLSFMEVQAGEEDPVAYQDQFSAQAAYDYIWFTPAVTAEDYCASLR